MPHQIYPDRQWYLNESGRRELSGHCPFANVLRCPRHHHSVALLGEAGVTTPLDPGLDLAASAKWNGHELLPSTSESAASITNRRSYANFCPEVTGQTFRMFASSLIHLPEDEIDRAAHESAMRADPGVPGRDWRASWLHVEPMHYSECPLYAQLSREKHVSSITFNAPVSGNVNIAGETINANSLNVSIAEVLARIDASSASPAANEEAKSRLGAFLAHPLVSALVGGIAGGVAGGA
jgi:hypothetical protein